MKRAFASGSFLPSGLSYSEDGYGLRDLHQRLAAFLAEEGIPYLDPVELFAVDLEEYYDPTDRFHEAGNREMARVIAKLVRGMDDAPRP